jgi:hypothetical protein
MEGERLFLRTEREPRWNRCGAGSQFGLPGHFGISSENGDAGPEQQQHQTYGGECDRICRVRLHGCC